MATRTKKPDPAPVVKVKPRLKGKVPAKVAPVKAVKKVAQVKPVIKPAPAKAAKQPVKGRAPKAEKAVTVIVDKKEAPITPSEERFIQEYLIDLNGTQAYMRAYPTAKVKSAEVQAFRLLRKPKIAEKIELLKSERAARLQIDGDKVVEEVHLIGMADMRELIEYRYTCCRCCYGEGFKFHRTQGERERDYDKHEAAQDEREFKAGMMGKAYTRKEFNEKGGTGYLRHKDPNPECIECGGKGVGGVLIKDTAHLSKAAAALYAGVKEGKEGIEVKAHSKLDALEKLFKHLGLYEADNSQKDEGSKITREELAALYVEARATADASREAMVARRKQFEADDAKEAGGR